MRRLEVVGIVGREIRLSRDEIKMGGKARPGIRLEHPVRKRVLEGHTPVRFDLRSRDQGIGKCRGLLRMGLNEVPAVHLAVVVFEFPAFVLMIDVGRIVEIDRMKRDRTAVAQPDLHRISPRESVEEVGDRAIFRNDDDDGLDRLALDRGMRPAWKGLLGRPASDSAR